MPFPTSSQIIKNYISTSEGQIHFRTNSANPDLPVLVCLHQTASSSVMYEQIMTLLKDEFYCIAPDSPGFGNSFHPAKPSVSLYAKCFFELIESLGISNFSIFGHHTGAAIAVEMAAQKSNQIKQLILSGPPYLTQEQKETLASRIKEMVIQPDGSHINEIWQRIHGRFPDSPLELVHRETILSTLAGKSALGAYHAVFEHDFSYKLEKINCPTLLMVGENDTIRASLEPTQNKLPQAKVKIIPEANTYICDLLPEVVADTIKEFIKSS